ncbi:hypothetical protein Mpe_B0490 (plasmid) [Methylibium petroleiphilum PM1]|uniref:Uncharacterized protein n=1 Tax=Methylibium petroleiphilum (strain ATCC BAA-1232 / LMG 22953 / PM1) TaxID=420662 RepID=A2SNX3_METPP|nr:hypothetical protein Mpe_B0490 [Methylibium petroleiphilum PM1]
MVADRLAVACSSRQRAPPRLGCKGFTVVRRHHCLQSNSDSETKFPRSDTDTDLHLEMVDFADLAQTIGSWWIPVGILGDLPAARPDRRSP